MKRLPRLMLLYFLFLCGRPAKAEVIVDMVFGTLTPLVPGRGGIRVVRSLGDPPAALRATLAGIYDPPLGEAHRFEYKYAFSDVSFLPTSITMTITRAGRFFLQSESTINGGLVVMKRIGGGSARLLWSVTYPQEIRDPLMALLMLRAVAPYLQEGEAISLLMMDRLTLAPLSEHQFYRVTVERASRREAGRLLYVVTADPIKPDLTTDTKLKQRRGMVWLGDEPTYPPVKIEPPLVVDVPIILKQPWMLPPVPTTAATLTLPGVQCTVLGSGAPCRRIKNAVSKPPPKPQAPQTRASAP